MKTAGRENPNHWANASSNRAHGAEVQNRSCSIMWAAKQEKFRPLQECFFLTFPFIELIRHFPVYRCGKTGITAFVIDSAAEYTEQNRASGLGRNAAERNRHERQLNEVVGSHGAPRLSPRVDLVLLCWWSGSGHRIGRNFSSWRLAKGARIRQADSVRAAFLRSATRNISR